MPTLRDLTGSMDARLNDVLGDSITYAPAAGQAFTFNTWVEFGNADVQTQGSRSTSARVAIEVPFARVAAPSREDRISIAIRPGKIFAPASWEESPTGDAWMIDLKQVAI